MVERRGGTPSFLDVGAAYSAPLTRANYPIGTAEVGYYENIVSLI